MVATANFIKCRTVDYWPSSNGRLLPAAYRWPPSAGYLAYYWPPTAGRPLRAAFFWPPTASRPLATGRIVLATGLLLLASYSWSPTTGHLLLATYERPPTTSCPPLTTQYRAPTTACIRTTDRRDYSWPYHSPHTTGRLLLAAYYKPSAEDRLRFVLDAGNCRLVAVGYLKLGDYLWPPTRGRLPDKRRSDVFKSLWCPNAAQVPKHPTHRWRNGACKNSKASRTVWKRRFASCPSGHIGPARGVTTRSVCRPRVFTGWGWRASSWPSLTERVTPHSGALRSPVYRSEPAGRLGTSHINSILRKLHRVSPESMPRMACSHRTSGSPGAGSDETRCSMRGGTRRGCRWGQRRPTCTMLDKPLRSLLYANPQTQTPHQTQAA